MFAYRQGGFALRRHQMRTDGRTVTVRLAAVAGDLAPTPRLVLLAPGGGTTEVIDTGEAVEISLPIR